MLRPIFRNASGQEETKAIGRAGYAQEQSLWIIDGKRIPIKYVIDSSVPERVLKWITTNLEMWTSHTCLTFEKQELPEDVNAWCDEEVPKREKKVMRFILEGGTTEIGLSEMITGRCTPIYLKDLDDRDNIVNSISLGRGIGLMEFLYRSDVKKYISYNWEVLELEMLTTLSTMDYYFKCWGKGMESALPFDYLSMMGWYSYKFGRTDAHPSIVTRDPYQQYLMDYRDYHALPTSHLDIQTTNLAYKCIADWESTCKASGKEVPKCQNFGYVTKDCVCLCLPVYTGKVCETQIEPNFPYPMQEGAFNYTIAEGGRFDMGELLPLKAHTNPITPYLYLIVKLEPKGDSRKQLPHISVHLPFDSLLPMFRKFPVDWLIRTVVDWDCGWGLRMLWGANSPDGERRLACDCTSMIGLNEIKEYSRVLSARDKKMTLTILNRLGGHFRRDPVLAVESTKFVFTTYFREVPQDVLKGPTPEQYEEYVANGGSNGTRHGGGGGANGTQAPMTSVTGAAMTAVAGAIPTAAIVGGIAALLLLCLLCLLLMKRRKKKKSGDMGEEEEDEDGSGGSDTD